MRLMFIKLTNFDSGEPMWLPTDAQAIYAHQEKAHSSPFPGKEVETAERYTVYVAQGERFAVTEEPEEILERLNHMLRLVNNGTVTMTGVHTFDADHGDRPES